MSGKASATWNSASYQLCLASFTCKDSERDRPGVGEGTHTLTAPGDSNQIV